MPPNAMNDTPQRQLKALVRHFAKPDESMNHRLTRLANMLGANRNPPRKVWTNKRLYAILAGDAPGPVLHDAIRTLYFKTIIKKSSRKRWRLHVQFDSEEEWRLVRDHVPGDERRNLLLMIAQNEVD